MPLLLRCDQRARPAAQLREWRDPDRSREGVVSKTVEAKLVEEETSTPLLRPGRAFPLEFPTPPKSWDERGNHQLGRANRGHRFPC